MIDDQAGKEGEDAAPFYFSTTKNIGSCVASLR
jgi:hypothetical protein